VFNKLAQFRRIETVNQVRQFINYLIWELDVIVHPEAAGADYVDAYGRPYFTPEEALLYDDLIEQCWRVDICALRGAATFETRARTLLEYIKDDEFVAGHDAAEAAQEWARTSIPLECIEAYWGAGCFDPCDTERLYRDGIRPEDCAEAIDIGGGEMVPAGYAACMRLPF
jgi:hypothetical protein